MYIVNVTDKDVHIVNMSGKQEIKWNEIRYNKYNEYKYN